MRAAGLFRISSRIPILPTSWRRPARRMRSVVRGSRPSSSAISPARSATRCEWPRRLLLDLELAGAEEDLLLDAQVEALLVEAELTPVEGAKQGVLKGAELDRLDEVLGGAAAEEVGGGMGVVDRGEHDDGERAIAFEGEAEESGAVEAGHADVADHGIEALAVEPDEGVVAVGRELDLVAGAAEVARHGDPDRLVVVDDEDAGDRGVGGRRGLVDHGAGGGAGGWMPRRSGMWSRRTVQPSSVRSRVTVAPCKSRTVVAAVGVEPSSATTMTRPSSSTV
ncbi:MAG: hypothetical protein MUF40_06665, partial [Gemmatimonadaceae bacterium]|nr:hypothetical protein [Gemmatimonadaceae bacterium]